MEQYSIKQRVAMEDQRKSADIVNRDPTFGSSLLNEDFAQRLTDDEITVPDSLESEAAAGDQARRSDVAGVCAADLVEKGQESTLAALLQNPDGATQLFANMHGISGELEESDTLPVESGLRHIAGVAVQPVGGRLGTTDWGAGTDGGNSGRPQNGVAYGSFAGV